MNDDLVSMRHQPSLHEHRPANFGGLLLALFATVLSTACTDRMISSDDRWSAGGELIAMSGGEGGARYACVSCHGARGEGNGFDAPRRPACRRATCKSRWKTTQRACARTR